ncbi:MAG: glycine zipper 2TM domain-containing protein [Burkholderiaceae bacterium]|nr:glycine zipper 2TM domain-containing protein [Burkholderiaceae bacterium]
MELNNNHPMAQPGVQPTFGDKLRSSKALIPTLAVMAVAVAALATTLLVTRTHAQNGQNAIGDVPAVTQVVTPAPLAALAPPPVQAPARAPVVARAPAPVSSVVTPRPAPPMVVAQKVCHSCGVVESVTPVTRQGEVNGIGNSQIGVGTVAGGVLGAVLGNQIGHGNGRTAATVLGAAGGAYAGNAVEKNMKKVTVYQMHIRMNDGSYRTIEHSTAIATGSRVVVEGQSVRLQNGEG